MCALFASSQNFLAAEKGRARMDFKKLLARKNRLEGFPGFPYLVACGKTREHCQVAAIARLRTQRNLIRERSLVLISWSRDDLLAQLWAGVAMRQRLHAEEVSIHWWSKSFLAFRPH
jgi:hypothetical protein